DPAVADPAPAAQHAARTLHRACRVHYSLSRIRSIPILAPLPDIAVHLVQPPVIAWQRLHGDSLSSIESTFPPGMRIVAVIIHLLWRDLIPKGERCRGAGSAGIFPLGFGWQVEQQVWCGIIDTGQKALHVLPAHLFD